jgi:hypothetical protein
MAMASLSAEQLDDLQAFLKDWLRHTGRTQADLRRALKAASIRMPVLLEALQTTYGQAGLTGLAAQLCAIEDSWHQEDAAAPSPGSTPAGRLDDSFAQLDMLLEEIRGASGTPGAGQG